MGKIKVVITQGHRWSYFQWFILGFYKLQKQGKIDFKLELPLVEKLPFYSRTTFMNKVTRKIQFEKGKDSYHMDGYVVDENGKRHNFTVDSADTPFMFDVKRLGSVDVYFKMQYPKCIEEDAFTLSSKVTIPWLDSEDDDCKYRRNSNRGQRHIIENFQEYRHKILPLMIGPRQLSRGDSYQVLEAAYQNYVKNYRETKEKKAMCYFGNAKGPKILDTITKDNADLGSERDINSLYRGIVSHPNEKRAVINDYLMRNGGGTTMPDLSARIIAA